MALNTNVKFARKLHRTDATSAAGRFMVGIYSDRATHLSLNNKMADYYQTKDDIRNRFKNAWNRVSRPIPWHFENNHLFRLMRNINRVTFGLSAGVIASAPVRRAFTRTVRPMWERNPWLVGGSASAAVTGAIYSVAAPIFKESLGSVPEIIERTAAGDLAKYVMYQTGMEEEPDYPRPEYERRVAKYDAAYAAAQQAGVVPIQYKLMLDKPYQMNEYMTHAIALLTNTAVLAFKLHQGYGAAVEQGAHMGRHPITRAALMTLGIRGHYEQEDFYYGEPSDAEGDPAASWADVIAQGPNQHT